MIVGTLRIAEEYRPFDVRDIAEWVRCSSGIYGPIVSVDDGVATLADGSKVVRDRDGVVSIIGGVHVPP